MNLRSDSVLPATEDTVQLLCEVHIETEATCKATHAIVTVDERLNETLREGAKLLKEYGAHHIAYLVDASVLRFLYDPDDTGYVEDMRDAKEQFDDYTLTVFRNYFRVGAYLKHTTTNVFTDRIKIGGVE